MRAKMIDWMIEVTKTYKFTENTFALSINIMDNYFQNSQRQLQPSELHLIGITCMFIASKFEEIIPFNLNILQDKISHKRLSKQQLKNMEFEILYCLDFKIPSTNLHTLIQQIAFYFSLFIFNQEYNDFLKNIFIYIYKQTIFNYQILSIYNNKLIAAGIIYVSLKIIEQFDVQIENNILLDQIGQILHLNKQEIINVSVEILSFAKSYDNIFPNLNNLKKYNGIEFDKQCQLAIQFSQDSQKIFPKQQNQQYQQNIQLQQNFQQENNKENQNIYQILEKNENKIQKTKCKI
ncbi:n-terminal domain protein [Ichthyophthirius multifiliis]|uniref:N-terminal domain protein n=1 Tax=Ichthyophthirius multifiliis TaxID=5932 RepID=G0QNF9_ICHMU|nr:n-terminal domain protein [Ichthyophthirius multifiliis]EGR33248.1 n-terminal domain protein [Ichthyophthirius multifiliis]|eukprot:XP_004037234.1 n-terminal domain protein [Ichthyophthirius multifiliis]